jgi:hypothetical protein
MQSFLARRPRLRRRAACALITFVASTLFALLAPVVHGQTFAQVCSAQGTKLIALADHTGAGHDASRADHTVHCPLCMPVGAPPAEMVWDFSPVLVRSQGEAGIPAQRVASLVGAPFPARGPPSVS